MISLFCCSTAIFYIAIWNVKKCVDANAFKLIDGKVWILYNYC